MTLSKYCKEQGMTFERYEATQAAVKQIAETTFNTAKILFPADSGMYYSITELPGLNLEHELYTFIIHELKSLGMEFFEDLWRI